MPKYIVHYEVNPSGWPGDPAEVLAMWEGALSGASQMLEQGLFEEINWVSNLEGYAVAEADTKAEVIRMVAAFFPLFTQDVKELTSHAEASEAILAGAKMAAESP
jgi:hypothetical protein